MSECKDGHKFHKYGNYFRCRNCPIILTTRQVIMRLNKHDRLWRLKKEIEPYALRLKPEVVMYKSTPSLSSLADWVERFLTIMRNRKL